MRYFDRNRRRLTKKHFVRGTLIKSNGENEVTIENSAGLPLNSIEIAGNTTQKTYEGYNLLNKEDFNRDGLRNETAIQIHAANVLSNAQVSAMFKPNTTYRISYEVECIEGIVDGASVLSVTMFMLFATTGAFAFAHGGIPKTGEVWQVTKTFTTPENFYENGYALRCYSGLYNLDGVNTAATCIFRNVQIVEGSIEKPYEPYVGGIPSPNPDYPQEIENANSEGMSVVLHGENLFNQEDLLTDANFTKAEYNGVECIKLKPSKVNHIFPCFIPKGTYTLTLDYLGVYGCDMSVFFIYEDGTRQWYGDFIKDTPMTEFLSRTKTLTATKNIVSIDIMSFSIAIKSEYYLKNIIVNVGEPKPYEPYFREEITIPTSIDIEEKSVMIRLAGNEKMADRIKVESDHVTYIQKWGQYNVTSEDVSNAYVTSGNSLITFPCDNTRNEGAVDYAAVNQECPPLCNMLKHCVPWEPTKAMFDFYSGATGNSVMIYLPDYTGGDVVTAINLAISERGPLTIQYPLETPIEHDITDTDFGQALLNLVVPRTQSGVLRVESALPASGLEVEYYSMEKEDKVTLEVLCVSEDGEELKRTSHSVRKDSKYQVKAPEIDGYTPINESIFGVASKDAEIIFKYKENEDATV